MKKVAVLFQIFISLSALLYSQIEYEGTVDSKLKAVQLSDGVTRYYMVDSKKNVLDIYNFDHSMWKSVKLFIPKGEILDEIKLVSSQLFNDDENLEVVYTTIWWDLMGESGDGVFSVPHYTLFVIKDTSVKLLEVRDGYNIRIIDDTDSKKLLVHKADGSADILMQHYTDIFSMNQN